MKPRLLSYLPLALAVVTSVWFVSSRSERDADRTATIPAQDAPSTSEPDADDVLQDPGAPRAESVAKTSAPTREVATTASAETAWILSGSLTCPERTPTDEDVTVVALAPGFRALADVGVNRRFSFELPLELEAVRLELEARYLYLTPTFEVERNGETSTEVTLDPQLGGHVEVAVLPPDAATDGWRESITLQVSRGPWRRVIAPSEVDERGLYHFGGLHPDTLHVLELKSPDFVDERDETVRTFAGRTLRLELPLVRGVRLTGVVTHPTESAQVGIPVRAERRNPVATAQPAWIEEAVTRTDTTGQFELAGVRPGELRLRASSQQASDARTQLGVVTDGEERTGLEIAFSQGDTLLGRVVWPDGRGAVDAGVRVVPTARRWGSVSETSTGADGTFAIDGLARGPYTVWALAEHADTDTTWSARVDEASADTGELSLVLTPGDRIVGRVVDDQGQPLDRFIVRAWPLDDALSLRGKEVVREKFRDTDGVFELEGLTAGAWDIHAEAKKHADSPRQRIYLPEDNVAVELVVPRAAELAGVVVDPSGSPVAGARVEAVGADERDVGSDKTDDEGAFRIKNVAPGTLTLSTVAAGLRSNAAHECQVGPGESLSDIELVLRVGARIEGRVHESITDYAERKVLASHEDSYENLSTLCAEDGTFAFEGLEPGTWSVLFDWQPAGGGGTDWVEGYGRRAEEVLELRDGETTHVVLGAPDPNATRVHGRVTRAGEPCRQYLVYCFPAVNTTENPSAMPLMITRTDEDGFYSFELRSHGPHRFSVGADTRFQVRFFEEVEDATEARIDFELPSSVLAGELIHPDGSPSARHPVMLVHADAPSNSRVFGDMHMTTTDEDGRFRLEGIQAGTYRLRTGGWGLPSNGLGVRVIDEIVLSDGEERTDLVIEVERGAVLEGVVLDESGAPTEGIELRLLDDAGNDLFVWGPIVSDFTGSFRFPDVGAGDIRLLGEAPDGRQAEVRVTALPGEVTRTVLRF